MNLFYVFHFLVPLGASTQLIDVVSDKGDLDAVLFNIAQLLGFRNPLEEKCTLFPLGFNVFKSALSTVYTTSPPRLPTQCFYVLIGPNVKENSEEQESIVNNITNQIKAVPKLVLKIKKNEVTPPVGPLSTTWVILVNWTQVHIGCPGVKGTWRRGLLNHPLVGTRFPQGAQCGSQLVGRRLRVTYHRAGYYFRVDNGTLNRKTMEGNILGHFLDKYELKAEFLDAHFQWGKFVESTQRWNGLVGNVYYNLSDVGITYLHITRGRYSVVDFSMPLLPAMEYWISKPPGDVSPLANLLSTFDNPSWILIGVSLVAVSIALVFLVKMSGQEDIRPPDTMNLVLSAWAMLWAEGWPFWFEDNKRKMRLSINIVMLTWSFCAGLIIFFFLSSFRSVLLMKAQEAAIDSTEQLVLSGKKIYLGESGWHLGYMKTSDNKWKALVGEMAHLYSSKDSLETDRRVATQGDIVNLNSLYYIAGNINHNPAYKDFPPVHLSKEAIKPYYTAWALQKISIWKEPINRHILLLDQAGIAKKAEQDFFSMRSKEPNSDLEALGLIYILGPGVVWAAGMFLASLIFGAEIIIFLLKTY